jgi:hypothetical protein
MLAFARGAVLAGNGQYCEFRFFHRREMGLRHPYDSAKMMGN